MNPRHARTRLWTLVATFAAVAASFFGANAVTQHAMARLDAASDDIAFNSAPSIEHLAALRSAARQTQFLVGALFTQRDPGTRAAAETALATVNAEANAYLALPTFPGEKEYWRALGEALAGFNGAVQRVLAGVDRGARAAAVAELPRVAAAADALSDATARAVEFNAGNGRALALRIKAVRHDASWIGWALTTSCALFALLAGLLARRGWRRYSELVEAHAALQESRARELEAFAGRAAHDILNPVSATQMALHLAARRGAPDPRGQELLERASRNLRRVRTIIDGLLQFARAGAHPVAGVTADLPSVLDDVVAGLRPAAEGAGIAVEVEPLPGCAVRCSAGVLTSAIANLAQNAVRYMGERATRRIVLRAAAQPGVVRVEVEDSGPGIAPDLLDAVFLPYVRGTTADATGIGLGLATVKRLCEAHGGRVGVRSTVGQGSTFWFELPTAPARARTVGAPEPRGDLASGR